MGSFTFTLFEYQKLSFNQIPIDQLDQLISSVEGLNASNKVELLEIRRNHFKATNYVGLLQFRNITIQVLPKVDATYSAEAENNVSLAMNNLVVMLSYAYNLKIHPNEVAKLSKSKDTWLEILTSLFAVNLNRVMHTGLHREYISIDDRTNVIRGKWNIDEQIKKLPYLRHEFLVTYDDFSLNNKLNKILKRASSAMAQITNDSTTKRYLSEIYSWLIDVSDEMVSYVHHDDVHFIRTNKQYEPSYNLAVMFLNSYSHSFSIGNKKVFALLFDMNKLFEDFVFSFLSSHKKTIFDDWFGDVKIVGQAKGVTKYLLSDVPTGSKFLRLKPDLLFLQNNHIQLISDAKYKLFMDEDSNLPLSSGDVYQMLAYLSKFAVSEGMIIAPQISGKPTSMHKYSYKGLNKDLYLMRININQRLDNPLQLADEISVQMRGLLGDHHAAI